MLGTAPRKTSPDRSAERAAQWASAPPQLASTLAGYIAQVRLSLRASAMVRVEGVLREFACWLAGNAPEAACVADLRRRHIEACKLHLAGRPSARGGNLSKISLAGHPGALRACFERLTEWDGGDVPAAGWCSPATFRSAVEPLPRFLDDGAFTKLLQATRAGPGPFVRLAVEFLARTGLRKGEFLDLTVDSVVQIGAAYWLHVPLGKLRTDRYIPLHPQLKDLIDAWLAGRPASLRTPYLFVEHGQRIGQTRVDRAVAKAARAAGIGHVSPHRLRHTLATQAKIGRIASDASFGRSRERLLPAAQRAALQRRHPAGAPGGGGDLGLHGPSVSDATMMRLVPLRGAPRRCACWPGDASGCSWLRRMHHGAGAGGVPAGLAGARGCARDRPGGGRDTRLAWGCVTRVAAGARMWHLIRLHQVPA